MTTTKRRPRFTPAPIVLRRLVVTGAEWVTPRMRRVTLGGPELGAFHRDGHDLPPFASPGFDDHVKLIFAPGGDIADALPVQRSRSIDWPPSAARETRDYTPTEVSNEAISFDFVVHTQDIAAHRGPAEEWAIGAQRGDDLWVVGPKSSTVVPDDAEWSLLIGDETALPALRRFFAERPVAGPALAVIAIAEEAARQPLGEGPDDDVVWVIAEPGHPTALIDAVERLSRPAGRPYVWAAAESRALLPIRKFVRRELGADKSNTDITGYWHVRDVEETSAAASNGTTSGHVPPVESPVSWFAVRAALQLGLIETVDREPLSRDDLAAALAVDRQRLDPLVDLLIASGVLTTTEAGLSPGPVGDDLLTDEHFRERFDGVEAETALLLGDLAPALRDGQTVPALRAGRSYAAQVHGDPERYRELMDQAERLSYLLPSIAELPGLTGRRVAFGGPGAVVVATGLADSGRAGVDAERVVVVADEPDEMRDVVRAAGLPVRTRWNDHDTAVLVYSLGYRDDAEARAVLREVRGTAQRLMIIEPVAADALNPRHLEEAVISSALVGRGPRDAAQLTELASAAGWRTGAAVSLGWGVTALICDPSA